MTDIEPIGLFDGEDVDCGTEPPQGEDLTPDEVADIRSSQQDSDSPPLDALGN